MRQAEGDMQTIERGSVCCVSQELDDTTRREEKQGAKSGGRVRALLYSKEEEGPPYGRRREGKDARDE